MRWIIATLIVIAIASGLGFCNKMDAHAQRVIDGDTLVLDGVHYRLEGIDAPELRQKCADGWLAGVEAASHLRALTRHLTTCAAIGRDKYGRTIGDCMANGYSLSASMVRAGMAYAYTAYSKRYVVEETIANSEGLGVHWHGCQKPWEWRKHHER